MGYRDFNRTFGKDTRPENLMKRELLSVQHFLSLPFVTAILWFGLRVGQSIRENHTAGVPPGTLPTYGLFGTHLWAALLNTLGIAIGLSVFQSLYGQSIRRTLIVSAIIWLFPNGMTELLLHNVARAEATLVMLLSFCAAGVVLFLAKSSIRREHT